MADVAICCETSERARALPLRDALERAGLSVNWTEIEPSARTEDQKDLAVEARPACVIVIWTKASARSRTPVSIARAAFARGDLIQTVWETCEPPPVFGRRREHDLSQWQPGQNDDQHLPALLGEIRPRLPAAASARQAARNRIEGRALRRRASAASRRKFLFWTTAIAGSAGAVGAGGYAFLFRDQLVPQIDITGAGTRAGITGIRLIRTINKVRARDAVFAPDGQSVFLATWSSVDRVPVFADGPAVKLVEGANTIEQIPQSPDGSSLLVCGGFEKPGAVRTTYSVQGLEGAYSIADNASNFQFGRIIDPEGRVLEKLEGHERFIVGAAFAPDGKRALTVSKDNSARVWHVSSGQQIRKIDLPSQPAGAAWSPDGRRVAITSAFGSSVSLWDTVTWSRSAEIEEDFARFARFSPDGRIIALSGDAGRPVQMYDAGSLARLGAIDSQPVTNTEFSPDGGRLLSGNDRGTVSIWLTDTGEQLATVKGHAFSVSRVAWAPDGRHFLTSSTNELSHSVRIWEIQSS
jgi:hypothetical protein